MSTQSGLNHSMGFDVGLSSVKITLVPPMKKAVLKARRIGIRQSGKVHPVIPSPFSRGAH